MTTQEIANRLHELCTANDYNQAHADLFADNATSTEKNQAGILETIEGKEALKAKGDFFANMIEEHHSGYCNEPMVFGNNIFMQMGLDITMKGMGRMNINEMGHYVVEEGKIVSERFYY